MKVSELLWSNLLNLKQSLKESEAFSVIAINEATFALAEDVASLSVDPKPRYIQESQWDVILTKSYCELEGFQQADAIFNERAFVLFRDGLSDDILQILKHYIPLTASRFIFHNESFLIAHAAQSLDGKMCTLNGASQWIGNEANLIHAHRIRAMVDGIIVGGNTMRNEHPKLSVRHVAGENPKRIVLCNSLDGISAEDLNDTIVVCGEGTPVSLAENLDITCIQLACDGSGKVDVAALKQALYEKDLHSVMLEGGPGTVNQFIHQGAVDWLQLHIAPILFGSGKSIYESQSIKCVADALTLDNASFVQMDNAIMMSGELSQQSKLSMRGTNDS